MTYLIERYKVDSLFRVHIKINSMQSEELNDTDKIVKLVERNIRDYPTKQEYSHEEDLLNWLHWRWGLLFTLLIYSTDNQQINLTMSIPRAELISGIDNKNK